MSKVTALYHVVFCTKARQMTIPDQHAADLYRFLWKEITDMNCVLKRIGGIQNHVHMLIDLHPSVSLSSLMQRLKGHSSGWMQSDCRFVTFKGWASGYFACTIAPEQKLNVINYIKRQKEHHLGTAFDTEVISLYRCAEIDYDDRDMR